MVALGPGAIYKSRDGARGTVTRAHLVWASRLCSSISMKVSDSLSLSLFKRDIRQHLKRGDGGADHGDKHEGHVRETSPGHVRRSLGEETKWSPLEQDAKLSLSCVLCFFFLFFSLLRPRPDYTSLIGPRTIKAAVFCLLLSNKCPLWVYIYWKMFLAIDTS